MFLSLTWATFLSLGPAVGAYLYDKGGFSLPFLICGSIDTIAATLLLLTIPTPNAENSPEITNNEKDESGKEPNISIEEGVNENTEKTAFIETHDTSKETTVTDENVVSESVLG